VADILVIDDEDEMREMLRQCLEDAGYRVAEAKNGKEGLSLTKETAFDLIIMDVIMPEKGGIETLIDLRQNLPQSIIIIMSGKIDTGSLNLQHLASHFGVRNVLKKPFKTDELLQIVADALKE
jgi:CheY-like chemotaxis protein